MRFLFVMIGLLAWLNAEAAKLVVESDRAIVLIVNLKPYTMTANSSVTVDIKEGKEGNQNVTVRNLLGDPQWSGQVNVAKGQKVKARWKGRMFEVTKREKLGAAAKSLPGGKPTSAAIPTLDELYKRVHGSARAKPDEEPKAPLVLEEDPYLTAIEAAEGHASSGASEPVEVEAGPAPPPEEGGTGSAKFLNRTGSWANLYVDGELVKEFRGERELVLSLSTGAHEVTVKDFQDKAVWATGRLLVYPDFEVELQFSQHNAPRVVNREEAWVVLETP